MTTTSGGGGPVTERRQTVIGGRRVLHSPRPGADLLVLVRLAGASGGVWDGVWSRLAEAHAVASVELGRPDVAADPRAVFDVFADAVLATAAALGHARVHLIGWNGGAHIALAAAVRAPSSLASVTLLTPFREVAERRQIDVGLDLLELLLRTGRHDLYVQHWFMAGFSDRFIETRFDDVAALVEQRLRNDAFLSLDVDRAMAWMRALRRDHVSDAELSRIAVPTLILAAGHNRWHAGPTRAMAEALHRSIAGSEFAVFEELGGFFPIEAPKATASAILAFIAAQTPAAPP